MDKSFYKLEPFMFDEEYQIVIHERGYGQQEIERRYGKVKTWELKYYDNMGYEVAIRLNARTKQSLLNKFRREFGYYTIIDIKEIEQ